MKSYSASFPAPLPFDFLFESVPAVDEGHPHTTNNHRLDWTRRVSCLVFIVGAFLACSAINLHSQIIGQLEVNVPFAFHAGSSKFPAGKYTISMLDSSDLANMEIRSADGHTAAMFEVREAQAKQRPQKTELVFNYYGGRYFLTTIFDEGEKVGSAVVESGYKKKYAPEGATGEETHVAATHAGS